MKKSVLFVPLALSFCSTIPQSVNCDKAEKVRLAAALALQTLDRVCPIGVR